MSIIEKIENSTKEWLLRVAIKKAIIRMAQLIVSYAVSKGIIIKFVIDGIQIDTTDVNVMTTALFGIFEIIRNWLKIKYPKYFNWL